MHVDISGVKSGSSFDSLLRTVGFIVVQWGHCEQSLELLVNTLFRDFSGNILTGRKRMPRPVSEKVAFLRECASQLPTLISFRAELEGLALNFEHVMQMRHDLVHGALTDVPIANGVFTFIRLDAHPDIHEMKTFEYDLKKFPLIEAELMKLGDVSMKLARRVFDARGARRG